MIEFYGEQEWIFQVADAVQGAVQRGVELLSGSPAPMNGYPGDSYLYPARTKTELLESAREAAEARAVDPKTRFKQLRDPARALADTPPPDEVAQEQKSRLILPAGVQHVPSPSKRQDNGPVPWML